MVFEIIYAVGVVAASIAIYFKFIDSPLDRALDKAFAGWHVKNARELKRLASMKEAIE